MAQAMGSKGQLGIQIETAFNTNPVTPDLQLINFTTESVKSSQTLNDSKVIRSSRNPMKPVIGKKEISGTISTELNSSIGTLLHCALGAVTTTGAGSPYTHVVKIGTSLPSFVLEKGFTDISQFALYTGCKINKMTMGAKGDSFDDISFDLLGAKETISGTSFDATPTAITFAPFSGFSAAIEEGGSTIANVIEIGTITVENNLDGNVYCLGSNGERVSLPEGAVKVSGSMAAMFENLTLLNKAKNSTESSLKITWSNGTGAGTVGNESLEIFIPELIYSPSTPTITGATGIRVELSWVAFYDNNADATAIKATLMCPQAVI